MRILNEKQRLALRYGTHKRDIAMIRVKLKLLIQSLKVDFGTDVIYADCVNVDMLADGLAKAATKQYERLKAKLASNEVLTTAPE